MHHPLVPTARERPLLSVCVPTFNRPALVARAIESIVAAAASASDEVEIVVSDNSAAVSERACREALAGWPGQSTYLGNAENIGLAGNLNQCIARAQGRYIVFVHDDDVMLPGAMSPLLARLRAPEADDPVLMFGVHVRDSAGQVIRKQEFCRDERISAADALERLLADNGIAWFPGLVVRADAYAAVGPFDAAVGNATDLAMWVQLFGRFGIHCIAAPISGYTVHPGSATQSTGLDRGALLSLGAIFDRARALNVLPRRVVAHCQAQFVHQVILGAAYADLRAGNRRAARRVLSLFGEPAMRGLRPPLEWLPARWISGLLVRLPLAVSLPLVALTDRLDLVRRIRAVGFRGRGGMPFC